MASLLSQELFDETIIENEECFDLSPDEALRETINQFCQQLGVVSIVAANNNINNDNTNVASGDGDDDGDDGGLNSPTSVDADNNNNSSTTNANVNVPIELSHLILTHPTKSQHGQKLRKQRMNFYENLTLLDGCVNTNGTVNIISKDCVKSKVQKVVQALNDIGTKCKYGDFLNTSNGDEEVAAAMMSNDIAITNNSSSSSSSNFSPLPYLAIFQRTSSIYTFMSFLSIIDPLSLSSSSNCNGKDVNTITLKKKLDILSATTNTLSSILLGNNDNGQCITIRNELRDTFVPALGGGRIINLMGGLIKTIVEQKQYHQSKDDEEVVNEEEEQLSLVLCNLLHLGTNATRGCESGKVAFVQSTLSSELNITVSGTTQQPVTKRGGVAVLISCLSMISNDSDNNAVVGGGTTRILTEACQLLASLCRYDDFRDPSSSSIGGGGGVLANTGVNTSSAHDHAMEFHRAGASTLLIKIARCVLSTMEQCGGMEEVGTSDDDEGEESSSLRVLSVGVKNERLAASVLTALRVLAINDEIIQTMVALGVLPIVTKSLELGVVSSSSSSSTSAKEDNNVAPKRLVAASLGLLRNLCGNDEIKTNLCLGSTTSTSTSKKNDSQSSTPSILPHLLQSMQCYISTPMIQEHACGTLAAMALRRPANARAILDADGPRLILLAMKHHDMNVNVQRQGALAVRNIVSRLLRDLPDDDATAATAEKTSSSANANNNNNDDGDERSSIRDAFLELGAENVLRNITGRHQGSVDEAYAALRDLGCKVSLVKFSQDDLQQQQGRGGKVGTMMFGEKHNSNFRPVYEESAGLSDGVDTAVSQFGT